MTALAESYDPAPVDEVRYLRAIARRNTAWAHMRRADELLATARAAGEPLSPTLIAAANDCGREYEHAERDLIWARGWWRRERGEGR